MAPRPLRGRTGAGARRRWTAAAVLAPLPRLASADVALDAASVSFPPFKYSPDFDLYNQGEAVKYFEAKFYHERRGVLSDDELKQVDGLRLRAQDEPVLALAAAQVLYMFGWFRETGEIIRSNVVASARLFERSIIAGRCEPSRSAEEWSDSACDMRWMHSALLYHWLGETEQDASQSKTYIAKSYEMLQGMQQVEKLSDVSKSWATPLHINFNSAVFPGAPSHPIWDTASLPIGRWLEENHHVFKAELQAILSDPRDLWSALMQHDTSREHLANPGGWHTVRIVRYHHWYDLFCEMAPRTCELIKTRPEIQNCSFMNVNYVKLMPGAHLKPHFGNAPRLSAHLSVIAPEPLRAGMSVATERTLWIEGKAILFDDTYPHCVSHWGALPRYVMLVWFCHPCDTGNAHEQTCPTKS